MDLLMGLLLLWFWLRGNGGLQRGLVFGAQGFDDATAGIECSYPAVGETHAGAAGFAFGIE